MTYMTGREFLVFLTTCGAITGVFCALGYMLAKVSRRIGSRDE